MKPLAVAVKPRRIRLKIASTVNIGRERLCHACFMKGVNRKRLDATSLRISDPRDRESEFRGADVFRLEREDETSQSRLL